VNLTYLRMEVRRLVRNRRVLTFSMLMPAILILVIGGTTTGDLDGVSAKAYLMVSLGLFGSMSAAIGSGGAWAAGLGLVALRRFQADAARA
jgi:ABC-2 type transport system permease protein